jgi:hypothetical protein
VNANIVEEPVASIYRLEVNMEAADSPEMVVTTYGPTWRLPQKTTVKQIQIPRIYCNGFDQCTVCQATAP